MSSKRTSITIPKRLFEAAQPLIPLRYCSNFSDYIADLIKQDVMEHDRRRALMTATAATLAEKEGTYGGSTEPKASASDG